jgi:hypothetical protein
MAADRPVILVAFANDGTADGRYLHNRRGRAQGLPATGQYGRQ